MDGYHQFESRIAEVDAMKRVATAMRVEAIRLEEVTRDSEIGDDLKGWADRLDAASARHKLAGS